MRLQAFVFLLALAATPLTAQGPAPVGLQQRAASVAAPSSGTAFGAPDSPPKSHWRTGMIIGGAFGLYAAYQFRHGIACDAGDCNISTVTWIGSIVVFGVIGGLIGSLFH